jgi:hypothetical protein
MISCIWRRCIFYIIDQFIYLFWLGNAPSETVEIWKVKPSEMWSATMPSHLHERWHKVGLRTDARLVVHIPFGISRVGWNDFKQPTFRQSMHESQGGVTKSISVKINSFIINSFVWLIAPMGLLTGFNMLALEVFECTIFVVCWLFLFGSNRPCKQNDIFKWPAELKTYHSKIIGRSGSPKNKIKWSYDKMVVWGNRSSAVFVFVSGGPLEHI